MIVGLNYAPEKVGIGVYTSGLAEALVARGHEVSVVAGKPYYPSWTVDKRFRAGFMLRSAENGVDVTRGSLVVRKPIDEPRFEILVTPRIGISQCMDAPLRFLIAGNKSVSRTPSFT